MLCMPTLQVSYPMKFLVLMESDDLLFHCWFDREQLISFDRSRLQVTLRPE